jgi:hypothetical protein
VLQLTNKVYNPCAVFFITSNLGFSAYYIKVYNPRIYLQISCLFLLFSTPDGFWLSWMVGIYHVDLSLLHDLEELPIPLSACMTISCILFLVVDNFSLLIIMRFACWLCTSFNSSKDCLRCFNLVQHGLMDVQGAEEQLDSSSQREKEF